MLPCGHCISPSGEVWDACAARGKVGPVMGLRPLLGPPCIPPEAPPRALSITTGWRGHASYAAGASLTRCTRSGDLPPRRVNARVRFRSGQNPLQPNTAENLMVKKYSLTFPTIPQTFCSSTLVSEQFTRHSKYRPFAFSAACHKAYPMLVFIAFQYLSSKAGREVTFHILARAQRG